MSKTQCFLFYLNIYEFIFSKGMFNTKKKKFIKANYFFIKENLTLSTDFNSIIFWIFFVGIEKVSFPAKLI